MKQPMDRLPPKTLEDLLPPTIGRRAQFEIIEKLVCAEYSVSPLDMHSHRRPRHIAWPRQIAMSLCRKLTRASLNEIGEFFDNRDHVTVSYAVRVVEDYCSVHGKLREVMNTLEAKILEEMKK